MKQEEKEQINETYNDYVESVTPKANLWLRMAKAFLVGGLICLLGQCIINIGKKYGFANSVAATAHGFKVEGHVFGVGARIFQIAGPVILYGIFSSWILGLIYWFMTTLGM